jgi:hypothetical protein
LSAERRQYRRIQAPVYCRPAGLQFLERNQEPIDVSMGGVRIYSDLPLKIGELMKLELFLKDSPPITYTAEVVWLEPLPKGSPAKFDVGLKFIHLDPPAIKLLMTVLGPPDNGPDDESSA